jgi:hypothetical protein
VPPTSKATMMLLLNVRIKKLERGVVGYFHSSFPIPAKTAPTAVAAIAPVISWLM